MRRKRCSITLINWCLIDIRPGRVQELTDGHELSPGPQISACSFPETLTHHAIAVEEVVSKSAPGVDLAGEDLQITREAFDAASPC